MELDGNDEGDEIQVRGPLTQPFAQPALNDPATPVKTNLARQPLPCPIYALIQSRSMYVSAPRALLGNKPVPKPPIRPRRAPQAALKDLTGGSTVPRVFIGGKFFGDGDFTAKSASDGTLQKRLEAVKCNMSEVPGSNPTGSRGDLNAPKGPSQGGHTGKH